MAYGLTSENASGFSVIDGTLPQLLRVASGTATVSSYYNMVSQGGSRQQIISIDTAYNNNDIFVFIKPTTESGTKSCGVWKYKDSNQWKIWFWSSLFPTTETIEYAVFISNSSTAANTGFGLNVYNPSGDVGFSSNRVNLRANQASMGVLGRTNSIGPLTHTSMTGMYALYTGTNFVERYFDGPYPFEGNMGEEGYTINWYHSENLFNYTSKTITMRAQSYYSTGSVYVGPTKGGSSTRTLVTGTLV
jgi:hypothetical protein|tara:strand:- start:384 stop:1124 length:741 start_codon:yes stop_codon:yes gene_type:complete